MELLAVSVVFALLVMAGYLLAAREGGELVPGTDEPRGVRVWLWSLATMSRGVIGLRAASPVFDTVDISTGTFDQPVDGSEHFQASLGRLSAGLERRKIPVWLVLPDRGEDAQDAVKVVTTHGGTTIGYLPSQVAERQRPVLDRLKREHGRLVACRALLEPTAAEPPGVRAWLDSGFDKLG